MLIVSAFACASASLISVSPMAAPAALSSAVRSAVTPIATSQPKNAAPKLKPPYSLVLGLAIDAGSHRSPIDALAIGRCGLPCFVLVEMSLRHLLSS